MMKEVLGATLSGDDVHRYTLRNGDLSMQVITLGATITSVRVPALDGTVQEITLGFEESMPYEDGTSPYFGCVAGRVANRIAKGQFALHDREYTLATNNGPNHLHGGNIGFDKRLWRCAAVSSTSISLELESEDGDEGYPGTLRASVTYSLPTATTLRMDYTAVSDALTPVNLTNHTYWNLKDGGASAVVGHLIEIPADFYTPVDDTSIPTGEIRAVAGAMDLRTLKSISDQGLVDADQGVGYDHNWCLSGATDGDGLRQVARVWEPTSGRSMAVRSDQPGRQPSAHTCSGLALARRARTLHDHVRPPSHARAGVQFYTGNYLDGLTGRGGVSYGKHHGFCLETQHFPDSVSCIRPWLLPFE